MSNPADALAAAVAWAAGCGLRLTQAQVDQLNCYFDTLLLWNRRTSLVSQDDPGEIACKHFADSLFAATLCRGEEALVDLGSGAGFPGVPIAIARPHARVCLIESRSKKVSFLGEVIRAAQVANASTYHGRIEIAARQLAHSGRYTMAISRAVFRAEGFLPFARPFLAAGGRAVAMRSVRRRTETASESQQHGFEQPDAVSYHLPDGSRRALLVYAVSRETLCEPGT